MPSDIFEYETSPQGSRWAWLSSQGLGVLCGQATVLLLAMGSILLTATRDGASAQIVMDELRGFFIDFSVAHVWLYALVPILCLYGLNVILATWKNVSRKWRTGIRAPAAYAAAVIHLSFLVALLAHLVGGVWSADQGSVMVGPSWQELGDGRQARVAAMDVERLPDGGVKQVRATVEVRSTRGDLSESIVSYNGPLSSGLGTDLWLLIRPSAVPGAAHLVRGEDRCEVELHSSCDLGNVQVQFLYLHPPTHARAGAFARVRVTVEPNSAVQDFWLMPGHPARISDGSTVALEGIDARPAILLRRRHAPGNAWAMLAALLLALGLAMMWRRFL